MTRGLFGRELHQAGREENRQCIRVEACGFLDVHLIHVRNEDLDADQLPLVVEQGSAGAANCYGSVDQGGIALAAVELLDPCSELIAACRNSQDKEIWRSLN